MEAARGNGYVPVRGMLVMMMMMMMMTIIIIVVGEHPD